MSETKVEKGFLEKNGETIKFAIIFGSLCISFGWLQSQVNQNSKDISINKAEIRINESDIDELTTSVGVMQNDIEYIKANTDKTNKNLDKLVDRFLGHN